MDHSVTIRPLEKRDYPAIEDIVRQTWGYDKMCSPAVARRLAKTYLYSCLTVQNFARVALRGGQPIGYILGRCDSTFHRISLRSRLALFFASLPLLLRSEGRRVRKLYGGIEQIDRSLLEECGHPFDGEVVFFAVAPEARGLGVGKALLQSLLDFFAANNARHIFVFTDSSCNYPFYESQGFQRIGEKIYSLRPQAEYELRMFLYDSTAEPPAQGC